MGHDLAEYQQSYEKAMGTRAPNSARPLSTSPPSTPPISPSFLPFLPAHLRNLVRSRIEGLGQVTGWENRSRNTRSRINRIGMIGKLFWIAGDPLSTNFPLPREGCSRSILIFHPLERGVKQGGTHCAGGGLIEVTWCLRSDVIPASLPPAVISFVLRRSSAVNPYVSLFLTICCSTVLGEISVGDYREAAFLRVHEGNPYVHCSRLG